MKRVKKKKKIQPPLPSVTLASPCYTSVARQGRGREAWPWNEETEDQSRLTDAETSQLSLPRQHLEPENDETRAKAIRGKGIREGKT